MRVRHTAYDVHTWLDKQKVSSENFGKKQKGFPRLFRLEIILTRLQGNPLPAMGYTRC